MSLVNGACRGKRQSGKLERSFKSGHIKGYREGQRGGGINRYRREEADLFFGGRVSRTAGGMKRGAATLTVRGRVTVLGPGPNK